MMDHIRYGILQMNSFAGHTKTRIEIIGETAKRYRIKAITTTRTAGALVYLEPGQIALVPKTAVTIEKI
jgi:hypothetical protein